jgi:hypothetical protein
MNRRAKTNEKELMSALDRLLLLAPPGPADFGVVAAPEELEVLPRFAIGNQSKQMNVRTGYRRAVLIFGRQPTKLPTRKKCQTEYR